MKIRSIINLLFIIAMLIPDSVFSTEYTKTYGFYGFNEDESTEDLEKLFSKLTNEVKDKFKSINKILAQAVEKELSDTEAAKYKRTVAALKEQVSNLQKNYQYLTQNQDFFSKNEIELKEIDRLLEETKSLIPQAEEKLNPSIPPLPEILATHFYLQAPFEKFELHPNDRAEAVDIMTLATVPVGFSPQRGFIIVSNGYLKSLLEQKKKEAEELSFEDDEEEELDPSVILTKQLFNISQEDVVVPTALPRNPAIALSPSLIAQLIRYVHTPLPAFPDSFLEEWFTFYKEHVKHRDKKISTIQNFKRSLQQTFLPALRASAKFNPYLTTDLLLASLYFKLKSQQTLQKKIDVFSEYSKTLLGKDPALLFYHKDDFKRLFELFSTQSFSPREIEGLLDPLTYTLETISRQTSLEDMLCFWTNYKNGSNTAIYKGHENPFCGENALRTIISMIFYDPTDNRLRIPDYAKKFVAPDLAYFIEQYGYLDRPIEQTEKERTKFAQMDQAWINLLQERNGIQYAFMIDKKAVYGIVPTIKNVVTLLKQLLGNPGITSPDSDPIHQFQELLTFYRVTIQEKDRSTFCSEEHPIFLINFFLTKTYTNKNSFNFYVSFNTSHASIRLVKGNILCPKEFVRALLYATNSTDQSYLDILQVPFHEVLNNFGKYLTVEEMEHYIKLYLKTHADFSFYNEEFLNNVFFSPTILKILRDTGFSAQKAIMQSLSHGNPFSNPFIENIVTFIDVHERFVIDGEETSLIEWAQKHNEYFLRIIKKHEKQ